MKNSTKDWKDVFPEWVTTSGQLRNHKSCPKTEIFIYRANSVHNNKYTYDKSVYTSTKLKVIITCHLHGDFKQSPNHHLAGIGCQKCAGNYAKTTQEFISQANSLHSNKYVYGKVDYVGAKVKVRITCKDHGDFNQTPDSHLRGKGCYHCYIDLSTATTQEFVDKALLIHKGKYTYGKVDYVGAKVKVIITCKDHGDFEQLPNSHLQSGRCPKCAGYDHKILYLLRVDGTDNYKIGVPTCRVGKRVNQLNRAIKDAIGGTTSLITHVVIDNPMEVEKEIHKLPYKKPYMSHRFDGYTEYRTIPNIEWLLAKYY